VKQGEGATAPMSISTDPLEDEVARIFSDTLKLPLDTLKGTPSLEDLPVDSIDLMQVVEQIEEAFDVSIPDEEWAAALSLRDVAALVGAHRSPDAR